MALVVMKFGGTSVGDLDRIENVARRVQAAAEAGDHIAVVVSAMAGETDRLVGLARQASPMHDAREYDVIVSSGEQVSSGLLAMTLQRLGVHARSWMGWQIPLRTNDVHGAARILEIEASAMKDRVLGGQVAVAAGFQGIGPDGRVATLGRGGSDTSAVALAAALKADRCDIYTDVDGVYTTDPRIVPRARKIEKISYEEMLEMASLGAKVLQTRSVELAMKESVRLQVLSSFEDKPGTLVCSEEEIVEQELVTGLAYTKAEAKITLIGVPDAPGTSAAVFGPMADANINVDMIIQNISEDGKSTDMTFTVPVADYDRAMAAMTTLQADMNFDRIVSDKNVAKISVIGIGMRSHAGVAATMFRTLSDKQINILAISTSEIKISVLVSEDYTELALRSLHTAYGLDGPDAS
ncbi:MAG: aspartate kinase [Pseudomonadota bacterium]